MALFNKYKSTNKHVDHRFEGRTPFGNVDRWSRARYHGQERQFFCAKRFKIRYTITETLLATVVYHKIIHAGLKYVFV